MYDTIIVNIGKGEIQIKILTTAMVSNSEMTKNYKDCRDKAESFDKLFILKNNRPDAVLFSYSEYERLSVFIEYLESLEEKDIAQAIETLPMPVNNKSYSIGLIRQDIKQLVAVDIVL